MPNQTILKTALLGATSLCATAAFGQDFNIPAGALENALSAYTAQTGVQLLYPDTLVNGARTTGVKGEMPPDAALSRLLTGTGLSIRREDSAIVIVRSNTSREELPSTSDIRLAQALPPPRSAVETVTVTSSKLGGADVQSIPIAITALSQEQLTATQTAGGPDLIKQVPNMTFTKTNFSGY